MLPVNSNLSALERVSSWTAASLATAAVAFIIELLWLERLLPMTSDQGQVVMAAIIFIWLLVTLAGLWKRPNWLMLIGIPLALFAPILIVGGMALSCSVFSDCP